MEDTIHPHFIGEREFEQEANQLSLKLAGVTGYECEVRAIEKFRVSLLPPGDTVPIRECDFRRDAESLAMEMTETTGFQCRIEPITRYKVLLLTKGERYPHSVRR